jgi:two-component system, response regulator YesN
VDKLVVDIIDYNSYFYNYIYPLELTGRIEKAEYLSEAVFNFELAVKAVKDYQKSTGIKCIIINSSGQTLYPKVSGSCPGCTFRSVFESVSHQEWRCEEAHRYGGYQAERFGGKYIFFCPLGLVHWAAPIISNGELEATILAGPVLMINPDEYLQDDIVRRHQIPQKNVFTLKKSLQEIPYVEPDRVTALSETLFYIGAYLSVKNPLEYLEENDGLQQQSLISEYIHIMKAMDEEDEETAEYPLEKEQELLRLISLGDKSGAKELLNEILGYVFFSSAGKIDIVKARVLELVVLLSRAAMEGGADARLIFGLNFQYLNQIQTFKTVEDISFWLSRIMNRFTDYVFNLKDVKHIDVIYKAIDYIKKNYMRKISLIEVADFVMLSPSYFSKLFKNEMRLTFNTFLNQVRIEKAKKLLMDHTVLLVDIAFLIGYEDQSYFSKVFKKMTGISPGKYRESRGLISGSLIKRENSA